MTSFSCLAFGVLADARARQYRRRRRVIGGLLVALLAAVIGFAAARENGRGTGSGGPITEDGAALSRGVTLRLPLGRATQTFRVSAPADHAYDVTLTAPTGSRITVTMDIGPGTGWTLSTRETYGCRTSVGRTVCLLHFAAGGNPGGTWTAVVRKASLPAVSAHISVVFMPHRGTYRSTS